MHTGDMAIATMTRAEGGDEEALMRRALARLARLGMPIAIADGGSRAAFVEFMRALPNVVVHQPASGAGLVGQIQASVRAAALTGRRWILYTEPDKAGFFESGLEAFLRQAADCSAAVVLASRTEASLATFPQIQQVTEGMGNRLCAEVMGVDGDYFYGPFLFARELAPELDRLPAEAGWGWRPFLFARAHRRGLAVRHLPGDYGCPASQRADTEAERIHRMRQLAQNVKGLVLALTTDGS